MKRLVICEGKSDGLFISSVLKKLKPQVKSQIFNQASVPLKNKKNCETTELQKFIDGNNPNDVLIKQEGGKDFVIPIFCSNLVYCMENVKLILILDLDRINLSKKLKYITKRVNDIMNTKPKLDITFKEEARNNDIYHISAIIKKGKTNKIGAFDIIFFKESLEHSCNICKNEITTQEDKKNKIIKFIENEDIGNIIKPMLE